MSAGEVQLRAVRGNVSGFVPVVRLPEKLLCRFYMAFFLRLRISFQRKLRLDILATGEYTGIRRFWREYLRMRFRREGGGADYLLFFYIKEVVQIRFPICIIAD